jgi:hypothetical protein
MQKEMEEGIARWLRGRGLTADCADKTDGRCGKWMIGFFS